MKILVSGGGTGGHIYPALAVATQLRDQYNAEILYLGSDDGLEADLVPPSGFPMAIIKAGKLRRYISWRTLQGIGRIPIGMGQAIGIVRKFRPDVAFTSGGYVAVPAGLAARLNGVPLLMHQQDVPPNLSNKVIAPLATRISVAFAESLPYFSTRKTLHLGNPVRQEILNAAIMPSEQARRSLNLDPQIPLLLITGGSQGARHLNQIVVQALPELLKYCQVLQISGPKLFTETQERSNSLLADMDAEMKQRYRLVAYLSEEMPIALAAAELVICRAGAATCSELAILGKPSILVPLPPSIGRSPQETNAKTLGDKVAAEVIHNADLEPQMLDERVKHYMTSPASLQTMANNIKSFAKPTATEDIVKTIVSLANGQ